MTSKAMKKISGYRSRAGRPRQLSAFGAALSEQDPLPDNDKVQLLYLVVEALSDDARCYLHICPFDNAMLPPSLSSSSLHFLRTGRHYLERAEGGCPEIPQLSLWWFVGTPPLLLASALGNEYT